MELPKVKDDEQRASDIFDSFVGLLHTLRILMMHDVPACGLQPNKRAWSDSRHSVGLVYASAVPVDAYLNRATTKTEQKLHGKMAEAVLVAQYYGSLYQIANSSHSRGAGPHNPVQVYLPC